MEHWRFFIAILLLLILMRPVHEFFTENDANILDRRIDGVESTLDDLINMYDSDKILDISNAIIGFDTQLAQLTNIQIETKLAELNAKLALLGTVQTNTTTLNPNTNSTHMPVSYTFKLPVGTWRVTANIVYISADFYSSTAFDAQIGVAINPRPYNNVSGYDSIQGFDHIEFPRTVGKYSRFSVSATIKVTDATTNQTLSIYDGNGTAYITIISTKIGF